VAAVILSSVTGSQVAGAQIALQVSKAEHFTCSPQRLQDGDTLTIRISVPHGRDLGIRGPDKEFHFVVFAQAVPSDPVPIVDWEEFGSISELKLSTKDLLAPVVDNAGWHSPTRVFTKRGKYRVILAANLETEYDLSDVNTCDVFFEGVQVRR